MKSKRRKAKPKAATQAAKAQPEITEAPDATLPKGHVRERPDGFYWEDEGELHGPFATLAEAEADMLSGGAAELDDPEALPEAESELGISEWIDPDTGGPAEDSVPRLEDH